MTYPREGSGPMEGYPIVHDADMVLYHATCNDGFCAAWLYWREVATGSCPPEFVPVQYGENPPDVTDKSVLIFDFSYPRDVLEDMNERASNLLVFDHHKTAQAELEGLTYCVFDMDRSGARLVHDWLLGPHNDNWMVDYVEDRDLWRWSLPYSKAVSAGMMIHPREFGRWDFLFHEGMDALIDQGKIVLSYQQAEIDRALSDKNVAWHLFGGHRVPTINQTSSTLMSDAVGQLAEAYPDARFAAGFFVTPDGRYVYSLRSRGDFDVSEVARSIGGGGHPGAAGFKYDSILLAR